MAFSPEEVTQALSWVLIDSLVADNARTGDDALVFVIGEPCGDCGGSPYIGLVETSDCEACRGCGRV